MLSTVVSTKTSPYFPIGASTHRQLLRRRKGASRHRTAVWRHDEPPLALYCEVAVPTELSALYKFQHGVHRHLPRGGFGPAAFTRGIPEDFQELRERGSGGIFDTRNIVEESWRPRGGPNVGPYSEA